MAAMAVAVTVAVSRVICIEAQAAQTFSSFKARKSRSLMSGFFIGEIQSVGLDANALELASGNAFFPLGWAGDVGAGAARVYGYGHGHIDHIELVNGFHAEVGKAHHFGVFDRL